ncbi:rhodanese-like domain-containing protein [Aliiruegeria lutimaris]|uniref:Rhodanese-related sulfurtransferase n=1 Tax=Aliiruegeria lutimaris TaxID=571298 RepID=A0A1G8P0I6_9RHOB|nr:rhodanese-like domain-containing protein [Aliiruegeria lutimaris]SDI86061.1 Rhodanese-related sulfurtransferase [Aliiruegeria lutimaris]
MSFLKTTSLLLATAVAFPVFAGDASEIPEKKQTKAGLYLTSLTASEMLQDESVLLLDVRSRPEAAFVGMPQRVDVHIPLMVMSEGVQYDPDKKTYKLEPNAGFEFDFLDFAEAHELADDAPIVIMCRSGSRSAKAADLLYDLGYTNVYSVVDGFEGDVAKNGPDKGHRVVNGWKNAGLEWSYEIDLEHAYLASGD